jgi:hypothetical protein
MIWNDTTSPHMFSRRTRVAGWLFCVGMLDAVWCTGQAATWGRFDLIGMGLMHVNPLRGLCQLLSFYGGIAWVLAAAVGFVTRRQRGRGTWTELIEAAVILAMIVIARMAGHYAGTLS